MEQAARFDVVLMRRDMTSKGWQPTDLARRAKVAASTVSRFLNEEQQTARMAKRLAKALGYEIERYIPPLEVNAAS